MHNAANQLFLHYNCVRPIYYLDDKRRHAKQ